MPESETEAAASDLRAKCASDSARCDGVVNIAEMKPQLYISYYLAPIVHNLVKYAFIGQSTLVWSIKRDIRVNSLRALIPALKLVYRMP